MSPMPPRERVWRAIRHQTPDRVPYQIGCTQPARLKLEAYYGTRDLDNALGNHLAIYKARPLDAWQELRPDFWRDEWGVVWNRRVDKDIGVVERYPLQERSLAGYALPDPDNSRRYDRLPGFIAEHAQRFRIVNLGFSLFERAWTLRGMPELLLDMLDAPAWVDTLLDAILAFNLAVIAHATRYEIDGVMFGDDWGHQQGLLMGPALWRRFILPRITEMYGAVKRAGKAVLIHSCGQVQTLFPALIGAGLDVFNPLQPEVMDPYAIKREFGHALAFYGGVSIQRLLPYGTPQQVRDETRRLMDTLGRNGGYILAPAHEMPGDIPIENMVALIETAQEG